MREPRDYEAPLCAEVGGEYWFPEDLSGVGKDHDVSVAKRICGNCRHRIECAEWGIQKERFGIWGGLTGYDRVKIRRRRGIVLPREERDKSA